MGALEAVSAPGPVSLLGLDPAAYRSHELHSPERTYVEINCYTDILIELIHARGLEPLAVIGGAARMDFEGDQWTFFKPAPEDLEGLLGIDIHEMQPYRPIPLQAREQIVAGRAVIVELDSWYMPDTAGTSYRSDHVKSSVVIEAIDVEAERMHYFHGTALYALEGEDYRGVFREATGFTGDVLPPYTELARFDAGAPLAGEELRSEARSRLRSHLERRPRTNPFVRFGEHLEVKLPELLDGEEQLYHDYAFATVRMAGSAFEALGTQARWLLDDDRGAVASLSSIVDGCKALSFKLARRRAFDPTEALSELGRAWEEAFSRLDDAAG